MTLTDKQIYDLNNMNVAAQNIQLGTFLQSLQDGGSIFYCEYDVTTFEEVLSAYQANKYIICKINTQNVWVYAPLKIADGATQLSSFNFKGYVDWETFVWAQISSNNTWYMETGSTTQND